MSKPILQLASDSGSSAAVGEVKSIGNHRLSPLADLVSNHLRSRGLRQVDFCRQTGFDQGLLSKILSSVVNTLNVETALKLAEGMNLPPSVVFDAIGKSDVDELLRRFYSNNGS
ncbi:MAG TPA: helix-turn-helix transcriptional regulator [Blastocatellia bacterium]|nr:helix-turn-helix transcriptional regulator [Blastocatellia bacterium]